MKVGSHVFIEQSSVDTALAHQKYKNLGFPLVCPCHLNNTDELIITDELTKKLMLLKLVRNSQLTVAYKQDLVEK